MDFSNVEEFSYKKSKSILKKIKIVPTKEKLTASAGSKLVKFVEMS